MIVVLGVSGMCAVQIAVAVAVGVRCRARPSLVGCARGRE